MSELDIRGRLGEIWAHTAAESRRNPGLEKIFEAIEAVLEAREPIESLEKTLTDLLSNELDTVARIEDLLPKLQEELKTAQSTVNFLKQQLQTIQSRGETT
jgi:hypothetical protein